MTRWQKIVVAFAVAIVKVFAGLEVYVVLEPVEEPPFRLVED